MGLGQSAFGYLGARTWHQKAKGLATSWGRGLPPPSPPRPLRAEPQGKGHSGASCCCNSDFPFPEDPEASAQRAEAAREGASQLITSCQLGAECSQRPGLFACPKGRGGCTAGQVASLAEKGQKPRCPPHAVPLPRRPLLRALSPPPPSPDPVPDPEAIS